jgi:NO-binding membrane sensor protein with MHYT domain
MNLVPELVNNGVAIAGEQLQVEYNVALVLLSYLLAGVASYVTLRLIGHFRMSGDPAQRRVLIGIAAMTLGGGIWGMHFVGMLAANWPVEVSYDPLLTALSLLVPVSVCGLGLFWMRVAAVSLRRLLISGAVTGLGIALMHYVGMAAMRAPVRMLYRTDLFALSIVIGIAAAVAAFWFGRRFSSVGHAEPGFFLSTGTAGLMAIAICGMHYTGMAALIVIDRPDLGTGELFAIEPNIMATMIALTLLAVLGAAQLTLSSHTFIQETLG